MGSNRFEELEEEFDFVLHRLKATKAPGERLALLDLLRATLNEALRALKESEQAVKRMQTRVETIQATLEERLSGPRFQVKGRRRRQ